jgi:hypothetical protein
LDEGGMRTEDENRRGRRTEEEERMRIEDKID